MYYTIIYSIKSENALNVYHWMEANLVVGDPAAPLLNRVL
jgi:hypothetical protein